MHIFPRLLLAAMLSGTAFTAAAQTVSEPQNVPADWSRAYKPFRIAGNLYYVGTYDLACFLVATPEGNILVNTGLAASAATIKANIAALRFKYADTRILLTTQAHYDHMGAMAAIKQQTGAVMMANAQDAAVMADGGKSDYALGGDVASYQPVKTDKILKDGDTISLGGTKLVMLFHPGHTKGSCSFMMDVKDQRRSYRVLIANMPTIVTEQPFNAIASYPAIEKDYAYTLKAMKALKFDIWLASHASQFGLHKKRKPTDKYNPMTFADKAGYDKSLAELEAAFLKKTR